MSADKPIELIGKAYVAGTAEGEALVIHDTFSLLGSVNLEKGVIKQSGHEHEGKSVAGRILVYYAGRGSSGDTFRYWKLQRKGLQPAAIVNVRADTIHVQGAMVSNIPMVCDIDGKELYMIKTGDHVRIDRDKVIVTKSAK